jgi:subtilisin inhibitor-like
MRTAVVASILAFLTPGVSANRAELHIAYWSEGRAHDGMRTWSLRCGPAGGTLPRAADACGRLARLKRPFAPISKDAVCTDNYGGPQQALVTGRYGGARVWVRLALRNGCEISRWQRLRFLTPGFVNGGEP